MAFQAKFDKENNIKKYSYTNYLEKSGSFRGKLTMVGVSERLPNAVKILENQSSIEYFIINTIKI